MKARPEVEPGSGSEILVWKELQGEFRKASLRCVTWHPGPQWEQSSRMTQCFRGGLGWGRFRTHRDHNKGRLNSNPQQWHRGREGTDDTEGQ